MREDNSKECLLSRGQTKPNMNVFFHDVVLNNYLPIVPNSTTFHTPVDGTKASSLIKTPCPSATKWTRWIGLLYLMIRIDYVMDTTVASKHRRWKKSRLTRNGNPIIQTNHEQKSWPSWPLARHLGKPIIKQPMCSFLWYYIRSSPPFDCISSCLSMQAYWMINSITLPNWSHKK